MSWTTIKLLDICDNANGKIQTGPFGSQLHQSDYSDEGIPVIMPKDMVNGRISENSIARVSETWVEKLSKHKVSVGDIIYSRRGDVGRCAIITEEEAGWLCGTGCLRVSVDTSLACPQYVFYYLQQSDVVKWVEQHAIGSTMLNLNTEILGGIPLSLPPLPIQRRIADILSAYDDLIENNQRQIKLLEEAAMRLYREWFVFMRFPGHESVRIVDGVPEGWEKKKVSSIMKFVKGKNLGDVSFEKLDGYEKLLLLDGLESDVTTYGCAEKQVLAKDGDILMLMDGARSSHTFITDAGIVGSTLSLIEITENQIPVSYVKGYFDANLNLFVNNNTGSAIPHANRKFIEGSDILIPNLQLLENYDNISGVFLKRVRSLNHMNQQLRISRDALLPRLMNGGEGLKLEGGGV